MSSLNDEPDENNHIFYDPVTLLRPISRATGISLDQLNFVTVLFVSFGLGYWYRLQFRDANRTTRAAVTTGIGLFFSYFCYGNAIIHLFINGFGSYILMVAIPPQHVHKAVFAFAMGYLLLIHAYRWMYQKTYCLDVTGSMMVAVGKITLLASAIHDGMGRDEKDLSAGQKRDAVKEIPSLLDFASYMFNFQTVIVGPMNHYHTWSNFLDLKHVPKDDKTGKPHDPTDTAMLKFEMALGFSVVYTILSPYLPMSLTSDPATNEYNLVVWWLITVAASTVHRLPYYFAWTISDAICNISGFGFDGLTEDTLEPKWSKTTNVKPLRVEFGQNYKEMVDNWNIWTVAWLRRVVYERVDGPYRTLAVYVTGAAWHGLAVGYYFSFLTSALFTLSAATFRRCMRHRFLDNAMHKLMYDIFGMVVSKFAIGYIHWPFFVMHFWPSLFVYRKLYMTPHLIALFIYIYLPQIFPPQSKSDAVRDMKKELRKRQRETEQLSEKIDQLDRQLDQLRCLAEYDSIKSTPSTLKMEKTPSSSSSATSSPSTTSMSSTPSSTMTTPAAPKRFAKKRDIYQAFADLLDSPDEKRRRMENKRADRAKEAARKLALPSISQPKEETKRPKRNSMDQLTHFNYVMSKKL